MSTYNDYTVGRILMSSNLTPFNNQNMMFDNSINMTKKARMSIDVNQMK